MQINKSKLIDELAAINSITRTQSERYLNSLLNYIYVELRDGNTVNISGFGRFSISRRHARLGVNPRTLQKITIPELNTAKFRMGEAFKNAIKLRS